MLCCRRARCLDPTQLCWPGCHGPVFSSDSVRWSPRREPGLGCACSVGSEPGKDVLEVLEVQERCQLLPSSCPAPRAASTAPCPASTSSPRALTPLPAEQLAKVLVNCHCHFCRTEGETEAQGRGTFVGRSLSRTLAQAPSSGKTTPAQQSIFTFCSLIPLSAIYLHHSLNQEAISDCFRIAVVLDTPHCFQALFQHISSGILVVRHRSVGQMSLDE